MLYDKYTDLCICNTWLRHNETGYDDVLNVNLRLQWTLIVSTGNVVGVWFLGRISSVSVFLFVFHFVVTDDGPWDLMVGALLWKWMGFNFLVFGWMLGLWVCRFCWVMRTYLELLVMKFWKGSCYWELI